MRFKDFRGQKITLSKESWQHIQDSHPEVSLREIARILAKPDEVRRSLHSDQVELYYGLFRMIANLRYRCVVVKILSTGDFVSSAMTTCGFKKGVVIYRKGSQ